MSDIPLLFSSPDDPAVIHPKDWLRLVKCRHDVGRIRLLRAGFITFSYMKELLSEVHGQQTCAFIPGLIGPWRISKSVAAASPAPSMEFCPGREKPGPPMLPIGRRGSTWSAFVVRERCAWKWRLPPALQWQRTTRFI